MYSTWYVLEDGKIVDPAEVAPDKSGALAHKSGVRVALRNGVPHSSGVELDDKTGKPLFAGKGDHDHNGSTGGVAPAEKEPAPAKADDGKKTTDMQPEPASAPKPKKPYKTR